ncbi:RagB/SusD family nutrient uptake outer membrane protein [Longitalea luteola]|uniref:RagB/SusD family nutrient uptake outer membrane protein n=1 Tax=Longitalea luteola TaxID=2812563 RepID=UPI001A957326|nr:RagB/SusD family nutrient uptake outer membrane protein [Longitalea luteola]
MKSLYILCFVSLLCSCSKKALETTPTDRYTEETFWVSERNAVAALSGCYAVMTENGIFGGDATPLWEETVTPNAYNYIDEMGFNAIASGTHTAVNSLIIYHRWNDAYRGIGRCNTLISKITEISMNDNLRNRMIAEAKFLRALYYTVLETYYGGVPLILDPPDPRAHGSLPRNSREEVVTQILKDIDEAASVLPVTYPAADKGRATKGAALGLKARILLFEASPLINTTNDINKHTAAVNAAKAVMDLAPSAKYDLFPNYRQLLFPANENNPEVVFDVQFKAPELTGNSFDLIGRQFNTNAPLQDLVTSYDMADGLPADKSPLFDPNDIYKNRDPRFYQTIVFPGDTFMGNLVTHLAPFTQTGYALKKYTVYDKEPTTNLIGGLQSPTNYVVIRYADILLMYAEARNEAVGPDQSVYDAVNRVRARAQMPDLPAGLSKAEMREAIRKERRIEFAGEGFYYNDIRRWKTAEHVMNATIYDSENNVIQKRTFNPARDYWWPIPQAERDLNPELTQNSLY